MFDINGEQKLTDECVEQREDIIRYQAQNPKAVFYVSHSAGKDSQAMYITVSKLVPKERIVVVHAHLGTVEHKGVVEHIENTTSHDLNIVRHDTKDFVDMVLLRNMFPAAAYRQCTSDLKQGPIYKFIRHHMKAHGYAVGFNCTGLRSSESRMRAMKNPLWINKNLTLDSGARVVYDFMPCFHFTEEQVYDTIEAAGQKAHWAYGERGSLNDRLSCCFCILGSPNDLRNGAINYPEHYAEMIALERVTGHTMFGKTKTIRTKVPMKKNDILEGFKVTKCNILKKKVDGKTQYSNTVFIPVSLSEKAGVQVDEVLVAKHIKRLKGRKAELLLAQTPKTKNTKKTSCSPKGKKKFMDTQTIDIFEVIG